MSLHRCSPVTVGGACAPARTILRVDVIDIARLIGEALERTQFEFAKLEALVERSGLDPED